MRRTGGSPRHGGRGRERMARARAAQGRRVAADDQPSPSNARCKHLASDARSAEPRISRQAKCQSTSPAMRGAQSRPSSRRSATLARPPPDLGGRAWPGPRLSAPAACASHSQLGLPHTAPCRGEDRAQRDRSPPHAPPPSPPTGARAKERGVRGEDLPQAGFPLGSRKKNQLYPSKQARVSQARAAGASPAPPHRTLARVCAPGLAPQAHARQSTTRRARTRPPDKHPHTAASRETPRTRCTSPHQ